MLRPGPYRDCYVAVWALHGSPVIFSYNSRVSLYHSDLFLGCHNSVTFQQLEETFRHGHYSSIGWLGLSSKIRWDQCEWFRPMACVPTWGSIDDDQELVGGVCLDVLPLGHAQSDTASNSPDQSHPDPRQWVKHVHPSQYGEGHGILIWSSSIDAPVPHG